MIYEAGEHELTTEDFQTPYVLVGVRTLVDPADPADVAAANAVQDKLRVSAASSTPFALPEYDAASFSATRQALLELAKGYAGFERAFGRRDGVDPVRHLIASAAGWGGLPEQDASYINVNPNLPVGDYKLTVRDVPVDGFWSISLYNADGFFEPNPTGGVSINDLTAARDPDGAVTVHFSGECNDGRPNCLQIMDGWNYLVRLYRPRPEILSVLGLEVPQIVDSGELRCGSQAAEVRLGQQRRSPLSGGGTDSITWGSVASVADHFVLDWETGDV